MKKKSSKARLRLFKICAKRQLRNPLAWAVILSIIYLGIIWIIVMATSSCDDWQSIFTSFLADHNWLEQRLHCRSFNELGDFLAGAFAPLAFLWLIVTVLIQAKELKEQRKELVLTRLEYKLNRDETRAATVQLKIQSEVMSDEKMRRDQAEYAETLDLVFSKAKRIIENFRVEISAKVFNPYAQDIKVQKETFYLILDIDFTKEKKILDLKNEIEKKLKMMLLSVAPNSYFCEEKSKASQQLSNLHVEICHLVELLDKVSYARAFVYSDYDWASILRVTEANIAFLLNTPDKP
jgi:hypothetical protein